MFWTTPKPQGLGAFAFLVRFTSLLALHARLTTDDWKVTYGYHYVGSSPDWTINSTWLQRVSDVIDMATSRGLYVLTNMHHGKTLSSPNASRAL